MLKYKGKNTASNPGNTRVDISLSGGGNYTFPRSQAMDGNFSGSSLTFSTLGNPSTKSNYTFSTASTANLQALIRDNISSLRECRINTAELSRSLQSIQESLERTHIEFARGCEEYKQARIQEELELKQTQQKLHDLKISFLHFSPLPSSSFTFSNPESLLPESLRLRTTLPLFTQSLQGGATSASRSTAGTMPKPEASARTAQGATFAPQAAGGTGVPPGNQSTLAQGASPRATLASVSSSVPPTSSAFSSSLTQTPLPSSGSTSQPPPGAYRSASGSTSSSSVRPNPPQGPTRSAPAELSAAEIDLISGNIPTGYIKSSAGSGFIGPAACAFFNKNAEEYRAGRPQTFVSGTTEYMNEFYRVTEIDRNALRAHAKSIILEARNAASSQPDPAPSRPFVPGFTSSSTPHASASSSAGPSVYGATRAAQAASMASGVAPILTMPVAHF